LILTVVYHIVPRDSRRRFFGPKSRWKKCCHAE